MTEILPNQLKSNLDLWEASYFKISMKSIALNYSIRFKDVPPSHIIINKYVTHLSIRQSFISLLPLLNMTQQSKNLAIMVRFIQG